MSSYSVYARDDPEFGLEHDNLFKVAYPRNYKLCALDAQKQQMMREGIYNIADNFLEHSSLDLAAIFQDFRLTGCLPTEYYAVIQETVYQCQQELGPLDQKITGLISTIAQLYRELTQVSAYMVQKVSRIRLCKYLLSSPKHIPQDVLEQIFLACLDTNEDPKPKPNRAPLQLAAVCHRWRTIALSTPCLWNSLYINGASISTIELAKMWASRCYLPSLTLVLEHKTEVPENKVEELILDALHDPSLHFRKFDLWGLRERWKPLVGKLFMDKSQPALEEIVRRDSDAELPPIPLHSLRRFYAYEIPQPWHITPECQLTVLWLRCRIHWDTLVAFLVYFPNLESLFVNIYEDGARLDPGPQGRGDIVAKQLVYFAILSTCVRDRPPGNLMERIKFPSLRVVAYSTTYFVNVPGIWPGFLHALASVKRLVLNFYRLPPVDLITRILQHAVSLNELSISSDNLTEVINPLTSSLEILPRLQSLYLRLSFDQMNHFKEWWLGRVPDIEEFYRAWSNRARTLDQLTLHCQSGFLEDEDEGDEDAVEVRDAIRDVCPDWRIDFVSYRDSGWFQGMPVVFGMYPLPFNEVEWYEVLEDDSTWTKKMQPLYSVI